MPKGGKRAGAGRPTAAQAAEKAKLLAATIAKGPKVAPRAYLQGLLDSPGSSKSEKLRAAELLLKLTRESDSNVGSPTGAVSTVPLCVYSVPRGSRIDMKSGAIVFPEDVQPELLEPFKGTPSLRDQRDHSNEYKRAPEERERFEVHEIEPPQNVTRLDSFKNRRDDSDGEPPGAA